MIVRKACIFVCLHVLFAHEPDRDGAGAGAARAAAQAGLPLGRVGDVLGYCLTVLLAIPLIFVASQAGLDLIDRSDSVARGAFYTG
jgi:hypothetical protein